MFNTIFDACDTKLMVLEYIQSRAPPPNSVLQGPHSSWGGHENISRSPAYFTFLVERVRWQGLNDEWRLYHCVEYVSMMYPASDTTIRGLE